MTGPTKPILLVACFLALVACGRSFESVLEESRPAAEAKLAQVETAGRKALTYHESIKDITLPEGVKLRFEGDAPNAVLAQTELFTDSPPGAYHVADAAWLGEIRKALSDSPEKLGADYLGRLFDRLAALEYLVIVRTRILSEPESAGDGLFSPGLWLGEVMVFEVDGGAFLGGASLTATNSEEVNVNKEDPENWLRSNLWEQVREAVQIALAPHTEPS